MTYRFIIAAAAMFAIALIKRDSLRIARRGLLAAAFLGFTQFCLNFNAVYLAERHITSGVVATVFALLLIPSSLLGWGFLGHKPTQRFFWSSTVAVAGIALLFAHELNDHPADAGQITVGIALTLVGMLGASIANVVQARPEIRHYPLFGLLAWSMAAGALIDGIIAYAMTGPPTFDPRPGYWRACLSRARRLGPHLQPLLSRGPPHRSGQGGLFERYRPDHRHGPFDLARRLSLDPDDDCRRAAGAGRNGRRAQPQPLGCAVAGRRLKAAAYG